MHRRYVPPSNTRYNKYLEKHTNTIDPLADSTQYLHTVTVSNTKEDTTKESTSTWPSLANKPNSITPNKIEEVEQRMEEKFSQQITELKNHFETLTSPEKTPITPDTTPINLDAKFSQLQEQLENKINDKVNDISRKLQEQVVNNINNSFEKLTSAFEAKIEGTMNVMIDNISQRISHTFNSQGIQQIPTQSSNDLKPYTQQSDGLPDSAFSPGSDVDMIGGRDP